MKIFVLFLCLTSIAFAQVIGIDFGTEFWKASLISPGKNLVVVQNSRSGRKSHNGISFLEGMRHFEYDAFQKRLKKPKASYFYLNKLIESLDHSPLPDYDFRNGTYYFHEGEEDLSLQQLVGMILKNLKIFGSQQAGSDIKDAVLTVPAHWGLKAKLALVNAAYLADLSILGIVNQNSAAAIHFAITRNDTDAINVGFFNLGSQNLQISIIQFWGYYEQSKSKYIESIKSLSHVSIPGLGGLQIDRQLADYVVGEFQKKHKINVKDNQKSYIKLLHKCADLKETLSANKQANIYIEGLIDGIDLNLNVKRDVIEQSSVIPKISEALQKALSLSGVTKQQMHSVEIIGGASRIPIVNKLVKDFFDPVQVGSHINGDEAMAYGAALRAANLSIAFRVKQLHFYDGLPLSSKAVISGIEDGVIKQVDLFDKDSEQGMKKQITIESDQDLKVSIYYGEDIIHEYIVSNISSSRDKYKAEQYNLTKPADVVLVFLCHSVTIAELKQAYLNFTINTTTTRQVVELVVENVTEDNQQTQSKETTQQESKKQDTKDESVETASNQNQQSTKGESQNSEQTNTKNQTSSQKVENEQNKTQTVKNKSGEKKKRQRTKSVTKKVEDYKLQNKKVAMKPDHTFIKYKKYTKEQISSLQQVILKYQKHEQYVRERAKIRSDFQSTLYNLKDDFENPALKTFSTQEELQKLIEVVTKELQWMDQNAWTAQKSDFESHFRTVRRIYDPIVNRSQQYSNREKIYNETIGILSMTYQKTLDLNSSQPWVSQKALQHLKKINETVEWIHEKLKEQIDRKPNQSIKFYNHEMTNKAEDMRDQYYLIKMTPRPKTTKKSPPPESQAPKQQKNEEEKKEEKNNEESQSEGKEEQKNQEESNDQPKNDDL